MDTLRKELHTQSSLTDNKNENQTPSMMYKLWAPALFLAEQKGIFVSKGEVM